MSLPVPMSAVLPETAAFLEMSWEPDVAAYQWDHHFHMRLVTREGWVGLDGAGCSVAGWDWKQIEMWCGLG
jgi:hypothetical protein